MYLRVFPIQKINVIGSDSEKKDTTTKSPTQFTDTNTFKSFVAASFLFL